MKNNLKKSLGLRHKINDILRIIFLHFIFSFKLLIVSVLFALLFFIASGLMADLLKDWYDAGLNKPVLLKRYSKIFTVSVVSIPK